MKAQYLFILMIPVLLLAGCKKREKERIATGTIVNAATGQPRANTGYVLSAHYESGFMFNRIERDKSYTFITDAQGNFSVNFKVQNKEVIAIYNYTSTQPIWKKGDIRNKDHTLNLGIIQD